jgi:hypothetical protein
MFCTKYIFYEKGNFSVNGRSIFCVIRNPTLLLVLFLLTNACRYLFSARDPDNGTIPVHKGTTQCFWTFGILLSLHVQTEVIR